MAQLLESVQSFLKKSKRLLINGEWVEAVSGKTIEVTNPANREVISYVPDGEEKDIDKAVKAARKTFESDGWSKMTPSDRANLLFRLADLMEKNLKELAQLETLDSGKPIRDTMRIDLPMAIRNVRYYAGWVTKITGETIPISSKGNNFAYTLREPIGVVGQIIPWNFPILMAVWKLAPALACGNTVILKPAEQTPLTVLRLGELIMETGFPPGVVNIVTGFGETAGAALTNHAEVDKIAFTGSTDVGRKIIHASANNIKKISLELGGKSPNVIFDDADLSSAIRGAFNGVFYNQGQVCAAGTRLFVQKNILNELYDGLLSRVQKSKIGNGLNPETKIGPLVSLEQLERTEKYIEFGKKEGAIPLIEGHRLEDRAGYFIRPTIFTEVDNQMRIAQEEIFGPVLTIQPFNTIEEVLEYCNQTSYGLASGVWTTNIKTAQKMIQGLKAGTVWVNTYNVLDDALPFGGYKQSGYGREMGSHALDLYTQIKSVMVNYD